MNHRQSNKVFILSFVLLTASLNFIRSQEPSIFKILSPDQQIECAVMIGQDIRYTVSLNGRSILDPSPISMTLSEGRVLGENPRIADVQRRTIRQEIRPEVPVKSTIIMDYCNELTLSFKGYAVIFRTYDNGVAYRFRTDFKGNMTVVSEKVEFNFAGTPDIYFPAEDSFFSHNERTYLHTSLNSLPAGRLASLPVLIAAEGVKVLIEESALRDYPGMWVKTGGSSKLTAVFPPYALESRLRENSDRDVPVTQSADFLAKTGASRSFPWRILAIAKEDGDLITNQLVYQLAEAMEIKDPSWIRP